MIRRLILIVALTAGCSVGPSGSITAPSPTIKPPVVPTLTVTADSYALTQGEHVWFEATLSNGAVITSTEWDVMADGQIDMRILGSLCSTRFWFSGYITTNVSAMTEDGQLYFGSVTVFVV